MHARINKIKNSMYILRTVVSSSLLVFVIGPRVSAAACGVSLRFVSPRGSEEGEGE